MQHPALARRAPATLPAGAYSPIQPARYLLGGRVVVVYGRRIYKPP